jgi:hypothetical protein
MKSQEQKIEELVLAGFEIVKHGNYVPGEKNLQIKRDGTTYFCECVDEAHAIFID